MSENTTTTKEELKSSKSKDKKITIVINGKEKKISQHSQYILDMLMIDDE